MLEAIGHHEEHIIYYDRTTDTIVSKGLKINFKEVLHAYKTKKSDRLVIEKGDKMTVIKDELGCQIGCFYFSHSQIKVLINKIQKIKSN